ncbi:Putative zn(2)-C6 fungal-type DNA-binding domain, fungal transcription factor [Septoria linicola]|uniref:Zn(2)-C6 fungal-type DNA-binding domain, fungal transcription factor n=1 Tax=Septoria linicola TaxID=215465 RepID=A0A9Q9AHV6_9PEZI|nr:putative zn(2)-C6 fungal-type DNA-binding domain, fungal transcription factor [Septoria linicola]USW49370.1 Putative zn(2)-C6 fungal-type DNA-binding domain, fungal transcription factor [Septoria linicola]
MPEAVAKRRSTKKSRGGCSRCKSQHLKCDESRPDCGRCSRLGVQCQYVQKYKWLNDINSISSGPSTSHGDLASPSVDLDWLELSPPPNAPQEPTDLAGSADSTVPIRPVWNNLTMTDQPFHVLDFSELIKPSDSTGDDTPTDELVAIQRLNMLQSLRATSRQMVPRPQASLAHQSSELLTYYFKYVSKLYAVYDDHRNPFRSVVSSMHSHSQIISLAAQSMAAACLNEIHPRFNRIGKKLRQDAMNLIFSQPQLDSKALLALMMFGPTGNWHNASDLGLDFYAMMKDRIDTMASTGELIQHEVNLNSFNFFREAMVFWEMLLSFVADSNSIRKCSTPLGPTLTCQPAKHIAHPWTGVARDAIQIVADIGRLVRAHRIRHSQQSFITQAYVHQLNQDLEVARDLENKLLACRHPHANDIVHPEDAETPVWHLTTLAELYRYVGLLQLYRVFPDTLSERLVAEDNDALALLISDELSPDTASRRSKWLTSFALEALRLLETMPLESGTRDFQPFLLVVLSSELMCETPREQSAVEGEDEEGIDSHFAEVAMMRKMILDRLTSCLKLLPPKPIRVCIDIVQETWRRIDAGQQDVYWLDVMVQNGWETIMA